MHALVYSKVYEVARVELVSITRDPLLRVSCITQVQEIKLLNCGLPKCTACEKMLGPEDYDAEQE